MNEKNFNIRDWQNTQGITGNLSGVSNIKEAPAAKQKPTTKKKKLL